LFTPLFTIDFPAEAIEPLAKLTFDQIEGVDYPLRLQWPLGHEILATEFINIG